MNDEPRRTSDAGFGREQAPASDDDLGMESEPEAEERIRITRAAAPTGAGEGTGSTGSDDASTRVADVGLALDLGFRLGISVVLGLVAGVLLDGWLHTSPLFTLLGVVAGIGAAMYTIWDVAREAMRK